MYKEKYENKYNIEISINGKSNIGDVIYNLYKYLICIHTHVLTNIMKIEKISQSSKFVLFKFFFMRNYMLNR